MQGSRALHPSQVADGVYHDHRSFRRLTDQQRATWEHDGYLVIPGVFTADEVDVLTGATDRLVTRRGGGPSPGGEAFEMMNIVEEAPEFFELIDHPVLLGSAMDVMGAAIHLLVSTLTYRPPAPHPAIRWHTDDPSPYFFPRINGQCPVWQLKCAVYLTDVDQPDMGNFVAAPGSHRLGVPKVVGRSELALTKERYREIDRIEEAVPGARQVLAHRGDVLIFHPALWHTVARNTSDRTRKNIWYVYGPLWMRLGDRIASSAELVDRAGPVRRQLLGATTIPQPSALAPGDQGAPLIREWEGHGYNTVWRRRLDGLLTEWWSNERD
jgi:phytanoyl-CoA dioxygenase PhyH